PARERVAIEARSTRRATPARRGLWNHRVLVRPVPSRAEASVATDDVNGKRDPGEELIELLNELRVALPGVQVLFAFLLAIPFTNRFPTLNAFQHDVYFLALMSAVTGTVLLIAPSSLHRLLWRHAH